MRRRAFLISIFAAVSPLWANVGMGRIKKEDSIVGIHKNQLRLLIVRPTIEELGAWSQSAEELLLGTAAVETRLGRHIKQIYGPALGIYQMEPSTHDDIWESYLSAKKNWLLKKRIKNQSCRSSICADELVGNMYYSTAMARTQYLRVSEPLPEYHDIAGLARYWKQYYNTEQGAGRIEDFIYYYNLLIGG